MQPLRQRTYLHMSLFLTLFDNPLLINLYKIFDLVCQLNIVPTKVSYGVDVNRQV